MCVFFFCFFPTMLGDMLQKNFTLDLELSQEPFSLRQIKLSTTSTPLAQSLYVHEPSPFFRSSERQQQYG